MKAQFRPRIGPFQFNGWGWFVVFVLGTFFLCACLGCIGDMSSSGSGVQP